jgi:sphingosine kinase
MSVSMGLAADSDINTEHLRWMGNTRFVYGFLRGGAFICPIHIVTPISSPSHLVAIWQRPCPIKISLNISERDKYKMNEIYQSTWHKQGEDGKTCWDDLPPSEKLPALKHSETDTGGWEDFDVPVLYFYGGLMPYVTQCVFLSTFIVSVSLPGPHLLSGTCYSGRWRCQTTV